MQTQVAVFPFLGGLEDKRQSHHVGAVELLQRLDRLGMILSGRATHQCKARQGNDAIHQRLLRVERVVEEGVDGLGEVQAAAEDRNHAGTAEFQLLNCGHVMGVITGDDVAALQH